jgi:hypothetical protein
VAPSQLVRALFVLPVRGNSVTACWRCFTVCLSPTRERTPYTSQAFVHGLHHFRLLSGIAPSVCCAQVMISASCV